MTRLQSHMVTPSLLGCDPAHLAQGIGRAEEYGAKRLHIDVMDGHFAPDFGFNCRQVRRFASLTALQLDIHLMTRCPERFVEGFAASGASSIVFHTEAGKSAGRMVEQICSAGLRAGVALSPGVSVRAAACVLDACDLVLVMGVEPGHAGEAFQRSALEKIHDLRRARPDLEIYVDGGIDTVLAQECVDAGATHIVMGTKFFQNG